MCTCCVVSRLGQADVFCASVRNSVQLSMIPLMFAKYYFFAKYNPVNSVHPSFALLELSEEIETS